MILRGIGTWWIARQMTGFQSFFMAGFECSSHRRPDGLRLDLIRSTGHEQHTAADYRACAKLGLRTVRDGLRWHLIERSPGVYDWSSWLPMLEAAAEAGVEIVWDLFHYGSPDHLDRDGAGFVPAFAAFAAEAARVHRQVTGAALRSVPINEISYFAWAVGTGYFTAARAGEDGWFKRHLVRAAVDAARAIRAEDPDSRFLWAEPLIHVLPRPGTDEAEAERAETKRLSQFIAYDMLMGHSAAELGGGPELVDAIGLNFYPENQWYLEGSTVPLGHHQYRPLADMLEEVHARYGKPIVLTETGANGSARAAWLHYVGQEVREAAVRGVRIDGICIYPVTAYPGWDDMRHCDVGLFSMPDGEGNRLVHGPAAEEMARQRALFASA